VDLELQRAHCEAVTIVKFRRLYNWDFLAIDKRAIGAAEVLDNDSVILE
jgi:hypothetical protein